MPISERDYLKSATEKGYGEPIEKTWEADLYNDFHTHDQSLYLYILEGRMELQIDEPDGRRNVTCHPSDTVEVPAGYLHTEKAGQSGVRFLVGRK